MILEILIWIIVILNVILTVILIVSLIMAIIDYRKLLKFDEEKYKGGRRMKITEILKETHQCSRRYEIGENGVIEMYESAESDRHYVFVHFCDGMTIKVYNPDYVYYQWEVKE